MKSKTILKITMLFVFAVLMAKGAFAQSAPGIMIENADGATQQDSVTGGRDIPYFVMPDPVLNNGFTTEYDTTATATSQGVNSTYTWWGGAGNNITDSIQGSAGGDLAPYIAVEWTAPGGAPTQDSIFVRENASGGGCNGDTSYLEVYIFDPPAFTPVIDDADGIGDPLVEVCSGNGPTNIQIESIADNYVDNGNLKIRLGIQVDSLNGDGTVHGNIRNSGDTLISVTTPVNADGAAETDVTILSNYWVDAVNGRITRYQFDFTNNLGGGDGTGGITDIVSRKSDYLSNSAKAANAWTYTAPTQNATDGFVMAYVVYPTPNTGNIYYVPTSFDE